MKIKHYFSTFMLAVAGLLPFTSCSDVPAPYTIPGSTSQEEIDAIYGNGTMEEPYTIDGAKINQNAEYAWVKGYIVGFIPTGGTSTTISYTEFTAENAVAANMVIAANPTETNVNNLMAVQLVSGSEARAALNLQDHPENLGQEVVIYGTLERYCGTAGVKNTAAYILNGVQGGDIPSTGGDALFSEAFSTSLGEFTVNSVGADVWTFDSQYKCAKATSYIGGQNIPAEGWLISPVIDLKTVSLATLTFDHAANYFNDVKNDVTVWIKEAGSENWTQLTVPTYPTSFTFVSSGDIDLQAYAGKEVQVGFKYVCTTKAGTYEVRNFKVEERASVGDGTPDIPDTPLPPVSGDNLLVNGSFEAWSGNAPTGWVTASTAGNATLQQSTDAKEGSYAVLVQGTSSSNKRLGATEMTLKAGTYTFSVYAKAATANGGSFSLGHVPVTDGKAGTYVYQKEDGKQKYYNNLTTTEWTPASYTFTLSETTTISVVVMNSKSPGADIIVDEASLTTSDGGIVDGGETDTPNTPDTPSDGTTYSLVSTISNGTYLIAVGSNGSTSVATNLTGDYGFLNLTNVTASSNVITTSATGIAYTITSTANGYTIQQEDGRYVYMKDNFNSFNVDASLVTGCYWDITANGDGTFKIQNKSKNKWIQKPEAYSSFGSYDTENGTMPYLFKKN